MQLAPWRSVQRIKRKYGGRTALAWDLLIPAAPFAPYRNLEKEFRDRAIDQIASLQDNPLYLSAMTPSAEDDFFKLHTIVHCSLDAVEEKAPQSGDGYLGLLYVVDDLKVHGYTTNTNVKFVLVVDDQVVRDDELKGIFRRFHTAYVDAVSNPFYTPNSALTSKQFDASVRTIATSLGAMA